MTNTNIKIKGLKKSVGDYQRANEGGYYDARYGRLMLDRTTGELWTDEFYSLGHNSWKEYHDDAIINLISYMSDYTQGEVTVNMQNVKTYAEMAIQEYNNK